MTTRPTEHQHGGKRHDNGSNIRKLHPTQSSFEGCGMAVTVLSRSVVSQRSRRVMPAILKVWETDLAGSGLSDSTIVKRYLEPLKHFAKHSGCDLRNVTPEQVVPYARAMERRNLTTWTRLLRIQALQRFFLWRDRPSGRVVPNLHHLLAAQKTDRLSILPPILLDWVTDLQGENRSRNTCLAYTYDMMRFVGFLRRNLKSATRSDLVRYVRDLTRAGVPQSTRGRKITVLRVFYAWLARQQGRPKSIGDILKPPKRPKTLHHWWQPDQVTQFRTAFSDGDPVTSRDRALCELMLMGLRVSEATALDVEDVIDLDYPDKAGIRVTRKGPKVQFIPLSDDARPALQRWLEIRPDMPTPAIFFRVPFQPSRNSDHLTYQSAEKIFKHYAMMAGIPIPFGIACHLLRHTAAQRLANLEVPAQNIQALLGHEDLKTTSIYFRVADTNLRRTVQKLNYSMTEKEGTTP
jgi:integrase/recombinase XerD